jgi:pimeloyl-ACP methyl ester carboxylesterase
VNESAVPDAWPADDWVTPDAVSLEDGSRLAVRRLAGDDTPVLLVHGLASNALLWRPVAERLNAGGVDVAVVDLRGHGRSERPMHGHSTVQAGRDLGEVAAALGWSQAEVVLAGQSWGGNVVLRAAAEGTWAGALAVDGGWIHLGSRYPTFEQCWAELAPPGFGTRSPAAVVEMIGSMVSDWPDGALSAVLGNLEVVDGRVSNRLTPEAHRAILHSLWLDDPTELYANIQGPVHLLVAGRSTSPDVDAAVQGIPDATVSWHPQAHHDIHLQQPDVVTGLLRDVIERVEGSAS